MRELLRVIALLSTLWTIGIMSTCYAEELHEVRYD